MTPIQAVPEPLRTMLDMPDRDYPLANTLGEGANTSKRLNYTTIFCAIALLFSALVMIFTH
jgi:hypothetical protein